MDGNEFIVIAPIVAILTLLLAPWIVAFLVEKKIINISSIEEISQQAVRHVFPFDAKLLGIAYLSGIFFAAYNVVYLSVFVGLVWLIAYLAGSEQPIAWVFVVNLVVSVPFAGV